MFTFTCGLANPKKIFFQSFLQYSVASILPPALFLERIDATATTLYLYSMTLEAVPFISGNSSRPNAHLNERIHKKSDERKYDKSEDEDEDTIGSRTADINPLELPITLKYGLLFRSRIPELEQIRLASFLLGLDL